MKNRERVAKMILSIAPIAYGMDKLCNWCIQKLTSGDGGLKPKDINRKSKTINLGFYSIHYHFMDAKYQILVYVLHRVYGYKLLQAQISLFNQNGDIL